MVVTVNYNDGNRIPLLTVVGPTATGKTDTAVMVAERIGGEVISADSMLVYRYMDIGTAKPTAEEKRGIVHHMIDIVDPDEEFTVAVYARKVHELIPEIKRRGKVPMLVGGTGLYVRAITETFNFAVTGPDYVFRMDMEELYKAQGQDVLHSLLARIDPDTAARLHPNDTKRIIRALEIFHQTGKPMSVMTEGAENPAYINMMFGLTMDREKLYQRINDRVEKMLATGLIDEVKSLLERGYDERLTSMQGLGYKEILYYLRGEMSLEEAVETLKRSTRRFAKRQMTWFRRDKRIRWLDVGNYGSVDEIAFEIIKVVAGTF